MKLSTDGSSISRPLHASRQYVPEQPCDECVMLTPLGRFVVENGVVVRGKIEKRSIFGTRVHETFPNA